MREIYKSISFRYGVTIMVGMAITLMSYVLWIEPDINKIQELKKLNTQSPLIPISIHAKVNPVTLSHSVLQHFILELLSKNDLKTLMIKFQDKKSFKSLQQQNLHLTLMGSYANFIRFLFALQKKFTLVEWLQLKLVSKDSLLKIDMDLSIYYRSVYEKN